MTTRKLVLSLVPALVLAGGCRDDGSGGADDTGADELQRAQRGELQWKRNAALQRDLMRALELPEDGVCNELGRGSCAREIHHISLGGADPLRIGLYEPLPDTLVSTPIVLDRVVMSACASRANLDRGGQPVVFVDLDLTAAAAPSPDDQAFAATITALYRRLLSRDPEPHELTILGGLTADDDGKPVSAHDFAVLACFAVGTSTEFLFF
ncbi:hypothetical protein SAMN02745121_07470 [Nannocystis exedens]|uniref:Lipoprotein n=1 Tax=Nannocystis exedens TaxID=54 RepID=A0A1I2GPS1_9BACT|nr:hypothetical protein [Nannocystis exedens]PCC68776.1 hypothetical protein NAEX_01793 [Nannocystis exedens]SFF19944.1 hypothetical protein SAMN02745121_07470 [Nannocystis exedens]